MVKIACLVNARIYFLQIRLFVFFKQGTTSGMLSGKVFEFFGEPASAINIFLCSLTSQICRRVSLLKISADFFVIKHNFLSNSYIQAMA